MSRAAGLAVPREPPSLDAYRRLGVRVIDQALRDSVGFGESPDRESARVFLAGSPMLYLWCEIARLDAGKVVAHAGRLMDARGANQTI